MNCYTEQVAARICLSQNIVDWILSSGFCALNQWTTETYLLNFIYCNAVSRNVIDSVLGPKQLAYSHALSNSCPFVVAPHYTICLRLMSYGWDRAVRTIASCCVNFLET